MMHHGAIIRERDVIHKTGSAKRIAMRTEEDRVVAAGNMHRQFSEVWEGVWFLRYACGETDRQTD